MWIELKCVDVIHTYVLHLIPGWIPEPYVQVITFCNPPSINQAQIGSSRGALDLWAEANCGCPVPYQQGRFAHLLVSLQPVPQAFLVVVVGENS